MPLMRNIAVTILAAALALPAFAEVAVQPALVRDGYFLAPDCTPQADPKSFNECICRANIHKAQVNGIPAEAASAINQQLATVPEQLATESCEGTPTAAPAAGLGMNEANANYEIAYQTPQILTVLITYSTYGAGAAHPISGTEGYTFDLASGALIDPVAHLAPEQLSRLNSAVQQGLLKKYSDSLFDETKARIDPYITKDGCDTCTLFYTKEGWNMRFQLYAIAPYATGEPTIILPADILPAPETLTTKK
jgi:hypothetical protein